MSGFLPSAGKGGNTGSCELVVPEIGNCLEALSGHESAGIVGLLFPEALERLTKERATLQHHLEELGNELQDALKKERQLLRRWVALLEDTLSAKEETAGESALREIMWVGGERSSASSPTDGGGDAARG